MLDPFKEAYVVTVSGARKALLINFGLVCKDLMRDCLINLLLVEDGSPMVSQDLGPFSRLSSH